MDTPIAVVKVVELAPGGTRTPIQVEVGCPRPNGRGAWACTVEGLDSKPTEVYGEDSLQALCLGLRLVRTHLGAALQRGSRLLDADDGSEFPFRAYFEHYMGDSKTLLASLRRRPAMYFGSAQYPFTSLQAFMSGVDIGGGPPLTPADFRQFVAQRFGAKWPTGQSPWTFIQQHTASEKAAFELFFQLLDEYENKTA